MYPGNTYFDCRTKELKEALLKNMCYAEKTLDYYKRLYKAGSKDDFVSREVFAKHLEKLEHTCFCYRKAYESLKEDLK